MKSQTNNLGRLVMVVEPHLSEASRYALRQLMSDMMPDEDVTMVTSLGRGATQEISEEADGLFYNTDDHMPLGTACGLLPWREMWLVANGRVWKATPYSPDDAMINE